MKIALINENSQAAKNALIEATLRKVVEPMGHEVVNYGMYAADDAAQLTYVQNGILPATIALIKTWFIMESLTRQSYTEKMALEKVCLALHFFVYLAVVNRPFVIAPLNILVFRRFQITLFLQSFKVYKVWISGVNRKALIW